MGEKKTPAKARLSTEGAVPSNKGATPKKTPKSEKKVTSETPKSEKNLKSETPKSEKKLKSETPKSEKKLKSAKKEKAVVIEEDVKAEQRNGRKAVEEDSDDEGKEDYLKTEGLREGLSEEEIQAAIQNEGPEFLALLADFKSSIAEIRQQLQPVMQKVDGGHLPTQAGVSYLELKSQLLLSYSTALTYYLYHKLHPLSIRNHPAIESLVQVRTLIDKLRPLDAKLKYQMDKLLKQTMQAAPATSQSAVGDGLGFRPNPDALLAGDGERMRGEGKGEKKGQEEEEEEEERGKKDGIYRPPRITAMHYEDERGEREAKDRRKRALKASKSDIVQALREEFDDSPMEAPNIGAAVAAIERDEEEEHRRKFEEENMLRLTVTKKDKKRVRDKVRSAMREDDFDDFRDLDLSHNREMSREESTVLKKRSLGDMLGGDDGPERAGFKSHRGGSIPPSSYARPIRCPILT